jgi:hypothetical protein
MVMRQAAAKKTPDHEFRARLDALELSYPDMARLMKELGDDRIEKNILRSIQRMAAGDTRVSGEMLPLLGLIERQRKPVRRVK